LSVQIKSINAQIKIGSMMRCDCGASTPRPSLAPARWPQLLKPIGALSHSTGFGVEVALAFLECMPGELKTKRSAILSQIQGKRESKLVCCQSTGPVGARQVTLLYDLDALQGTWAIRRDFYGRHWVILKRRWRLLRRLQLLP
jgi:hypothetical protein